MSNYKVIIAMLLVAIFAVGAVSATEDIAINDTIIEPADDIVVDDVPVEEVVESESTDLEVINEDTGSEDNLGSRQMTVINYNPTNYYGVSITVQNNTIYNGNGATLYGTGSDDVFIVDNAHDFVITGFNIIVNSTSNIAIHGANVKHAKITNNNISGGKDGINIKQTYENLTITGNKIENVTRDGLSLVDHETDGVDGFNFTTWVSSTVSNNIIIGKANYGTEYGMFFGGNFKGTISGNTITGTQYGMEFAGKKAKTNGKLCAVFDNNNMSGVQCGINMFHPCVICFNITNCNLFLDPLYEQAGNNIIDTNRYFNAAGGYIGVYRSHFTGNFTQAFKNAVGAHHGNNIGYP